MRTDISEDPKGDPTKTVPAQPGLEERRAPEATPLIEKGAGGRDHPLGEAGQQKQTDADQAGHDTE